MRALDACGAHGWGSAVGGGGSPTSLLGFEPETEFRGGLEALAEAQRWLAATSQRNPLSGVLIGWLAYDLGREFETLPERARTELPVEPVCLAGFRALYRYDPRRGRGEVVGSDAAAVARLRERLEDASPAGARCPDRQPPPLPPPRKRTSDAAFRRGVRAIQEWIRAGDVYQVNLSRRLDHAPLDHARLPLLYGALTAAAGAPFSAYLECGDVVVVSNSPERFLRVAGDRIETCPIKGTRPRGHSRELDAWLSKDLRNAPKDRAEHVMIVDLERNDLGRICHTGTVAVARMAQLCAFPTVFHLVSSV